MALAQLFSMMNLAATGGWLILIFAPRGWRRLGLVARYLIPGVIAVIYAALMGAGFTNAQGGFGSINEVRALFASDPVLVAGWGHYLAFDLIIGTMLAQRMDSVGVTRWLQAPVLVMTFLFGPVGWLLGLGAEAAVRLRGPDKALQS
jgi:CBS domain containing-hemolysin-like protein